MSLIHPLFMLAFFYVLYVQRSVGQRILSLKERSPEFDQRDVLIGKHLSYGVILLVMIIGGLIGGIVMTSMVLKAPAPFLHTYGHGFLGVLGLSGLVIMFLLGKNIKHVVKPKIRERFLRFHVQMIYLMAGTGLLSMVTGLIVLFRGLSE